MRVYGGPLNGGSWTEIPNVTAATWTDTLTSKPTCEITVAADIAPADWPREIIIVATESTVGERPMYGPYDLVTPGYQSPAGMTFNGELGHHFSLLFGGLEGDESAVNSIIAQVGGLGQYQPYLGWQTAPGNDVLDAQLGPRYISDLFARLYSAQSLDDVQAALTTWGLTPYTLTEWRARGQYVQNVAVWPRHPISIQEPNTLEIQYAIKPRVGMVRAWDAGAPFLFAEVNRGLPNEVPAPSGLWRERATVSVQDYLTMPVAITGGPPNWKTRRMIVGRKGVLDGVGYKWFRTGDDTVWPPHWLPGDAPSGQTAKVAEEMLRWDWQNGAAALEAVRLPDLTEAYDTLAMAPHQIVTIPAAELPDDWPAAANRFTVRQVRHTWTGQTGYEQHITGSLYQGPFERLKAVEIQ